MIPKYQCLQCITRLKLLSYNHDIGLKNMCITFSSLDA